MSEFIFYTRKLLFLINKNKILFLVNVTLTILLYYIFSNTNRMYLKIFTDSVSNGNAIYYSLLIENEDTYKIKLIEEKIKKLPIILSLTKEELNNDSYYNNLIPQANALILKYKVDFKNFVSLRTIQLFKTYLEKLYIKEQIGEVFYSKNTNNPLKEQLTILLSLSKNSFYYSCAFLILLMMVLWLMSYNKIIQKSIYVQFLCENIMGHKNSMVKILCFYNFVLFLLVIPFVYTFNWKILEYLFLLSFIIILHAQLFYFSQKRIME